jgi:hypothetical protein
VRVAIFEPHPRLCGVTAWAFHLREGFRFLGHECDVVSFTTGGKARRAGGDRANGWYWWHVEPDRNDTWLKAGKVLDEYDLIVLNEPKNGTEDRAAQRLGIDPFYIGALRRTKTPWTTALYAPQYDPNRTPYMDHCLDAGNFTGLVIEQAPGAYESGIHVFEGRVKKRLFWPWFPYVVNPIREDVQRERKVLLAGRSTAVKGGSGLAAVAEELPDGWTVELAGSESGGQGACYSYVLYQALTEKHGWVGMRTDRRGREHKSDAYGNQADKTASHPWFVSKGGRVIRYTGAFNDPIGLWSGAAIAVNLTAKSFSTSIEFTHLESMDAGCLPVMTGFVHDLVGSAGYFCYRLNNFEEPSRTNKHGISPMEPATHDELVATLGAACQLYDSGERGYIEHNRNVLMNAHHPSHLATRILEELA